MTREELKPFDPAEYLKSDEALAEYLTAALETEDASFIADALGVVARAKGVAQLANETGLGRNSLYKTLSKNGNPELSTVLRVMHALGLKLAAHPAE